MSGGWSWYIAIGTLGMLLAMLWLTWWTNRQRTTPEEVESAQSHVWDGDLRELNNPLPMWWLYVFVLTILWGGLYLLLYPGLGNFAGFRGWSSAGQYEKEMAAAEAKYGPLFARYGATDIEELASDPEALAIGKSLFANYCAQCHGSGGLGAVGFPDLTDDAWHWGGTPEAIEQSIVAGRRAAMPPFAALFPDEASLDAMVTFVQNMRDGIDESSPAYATYRTVCMACHGPDGRGNTALGAPSLVDDAWLYGSSRAAIAKTIREGRNGVMPAHGELLGPDRARILAAYVYSLSK